MADVAAPAVTKLDDAARWRVLGLVCAGVVLSMTTWFSATAITPELIRAFGLSTAQASWLTNSVQVGFVVGALASSLVGLPDIVSLRALMAASAVLVALCNLSLLAAPSVGALLLARAATGVALAGIYPPALKLVATWFQRGRGTALGAVIAALTLGSAFPHLVRAATDHVAWQAVVASASAATLAGGALLGLFGVEGPFPFSRARFSPRQIGAVLQNRPLMLANLGYFGHMWELYAMWGWFLAFATAALPRLGLLDPKTASLLTFGVVASGVVGALGGGLLADRIGRTAASALMMAASGSCALLIGFAFDGAAMAVRADRRGLGHHRHRRFGTVLRHGDGAERPPPRRHGSGVAARSGVRPDRGFDPHHTGRGRGGRLALDVPDAGARPRRGCRRHGGTAPPPRGGADRPGSAVRIGEMARTEAPPMRPMTCEGDHDARP